MVGFVSVSNMRAWLRSTALSDLLVRMVEQLEADFKRWDDFEKVPRVASHSPYGVIELMPTSDVSTYGFKYVNGHPINTKIGKQTVTAFGVLAEVESGYPRFVSEMTLLTALRTAATSALAAKYLARPDSCSMAMIGAGAQAEFQAVAFAAVLGIQKFNATDIDPEALIKFETNMGSMGIEVTPFADPSKAVEGVDIITTCTADKRNAIVLEDSWVKPGMHLNAIGGDCPGKTEIDSKIIPRSKVFVEFEPQTRIEGEIQLFGDELRVTELHDVLNEFETGRESEDEITLFDSVGFAIEDYSAMKFVENEVTGTEFCEDLDLIAEPTDVKDLFGHIYMGKETSGVE